jgi:hypothetical protein
MKKLESDDEKMTLADAAKALSVCKRTIQNGIKAGILSPVRCGLKRRACWVTRASVEAFLAKGGAA